MHSSPLESQGLAAHLFQLKTGEDTMRWLDELLSHGVYVRLAQGA